MSPGCDPRPAPRRCFLAPAATPKTQRTTSSTFYTAVLSHSETRKSDAFHLAHQRRLRGSGCSRPRLGLKLAPLRLACVSVPLEQSPDLTDRSGACTEADTCPQPEPVTSATAAGRTIEPSSRGRESDDSLGLITRWASALNPARSTSTYPRILPQTTRGHGCSCARAARANAGLDGSASTEVRLLQRTLAPSPSRSPTSPTHLTSTTPRPSAGLERSCELFSSSLAPRVHPPSSLSASAASHPSTHASWSPSLPPSRTRSASRSRLARTTTSTAPSRASRQTTEVRAFTLRVMERRS